MRTLFFLLFFASVVTADEQSPESLALQAQAEAADALERASLEANPLPPARAPGDYMMMVRLPWFLEEFGDELSYNKVKELQDLMKRRDQEIQAARAEYDLQHSGDPFARTRSMLTIGFGMLDNVVKPEVAAIVGPKAVKAIDLRIIVMRLRMNNPAGSGFIGSPDYPELVALWEATENKQELVEYLEAWSDTCGEQNLSFEENVALLIEGSEEFGPLFAAILDR